MAAALLGDSTVGAGHQAGPAPWLTAVIADLKGAQGRALVHVGADQPAELHALAHADQRSARWPRQRRSISSTPVAPPAAGEQAQTLADLSADMQAGKVAHLLILDSNPVFTAPATWGFAQALKRVPLQPRPRPQRRRNRAVRPPGSCRWRMTGKPGATRAPTTAQRRSCSPRRCRSTAAWARMSCWVCTWMQRH